MSHNTGDRWSDHAWRALATALTLPVLASTALAHGDEGGLHGVVLPAGVFLAGVAVLGGSVLLDAREVVERRYVDAGMLAGVVCVIGSIGIFWL